MSIVVRADWVLNPLVKVFSCFGTKRHGESVPRGRRNDTPQEGNRSREKGGRMAYGIQYPHGKVQSSGDESQGVQARKWELYWPEAAEETKRKNEKGVQGGSSIAYAGYEEGTQDARTRV